MDQTNWNPQSQPPGGQPAYPPSPASQQPYGQPSAPVEGSAEARGLAMLCHLLGIVGFIGPLMIWLHERDEHRFVADHGKAAMNYQVSILIYYLVSCVLAPLFIGIFMIIALIIMHIVFTIIASVKASKGLPWSYPIAIRFLK